MSGDSKQTNDDDLDIDDTSIDDDADESPDDDVELSDDDDLIDGGTAEVNVEELVAKLDATDAEEAARKREIREKLEALNEERDDKFGSTYNFNMDEDV